MDDQDSLHRNLTSMWSVQRIMFSRSGLLTRLLQFGFGGITRILRLIGLKRLADQLLVFRLTQIETYSETKQNFFDSALHSAKYTLFVDFGAHTGEQVVQALPHMDVIAFEPDPRAFAKLIENVNGIRSVVHSTSLHQSAVSTKNGIARLGYSDMSPEKTGGSTLTRSKIGFSGRYGVECPTVDVLDVLDSVLSPESTILKVDIEGAEYLVLRRMMRHHKFRQLGLVFVEFHEHKLRGRYFWGLCLTLGLWSRGLTRKRLIEWH
jgi:FkbM family methyltransferase